jgi:hypothetical protein
VVDQIGAYLLNGVPLPRLPQVTKVPGTELARWVGAYDLDGGGTLEVSLAEATLLISAMDQPGFSVLHSTRPLDFARCGRLSHRVDTIVGAYTTGDYKPLWEAHGRHTSLEELQRRWDGRMQELERDLGSYRGYEVLGTALRSEREITLVRFKFDRGTSDRAYVWDKNEQEHLLGVSIRGLAADSTFYPESDDHFRSWNRDTGETRALSFRVDSEGAAHLFLGENTTTIRGLRR